MKDISLLLLLRCVLSLTQLLLKQCRIKNILNSSHLSTAISQLSFSPFFNFIAEL